MPGFAEIVKSEVDETIVNETVTECVRLPLVPVTLTVPDVRMDPPSTVSVDVAVPFDDRVTLEG